MRKVKCDNRNEGKGHFLCPALGTDVITAAYHLVCTVGGSTVGHNAGECRVKVETILLGENKKLMLYAQSSLVCIIIGAVMSTICCVNIQLGRCPIKILWGTSDRKSNEKAPKFKLQ